MHSPGGLLRERFAVDARLRSILLKPGAEWGTEFLKISMTSEVM